MSRLPVMDIYLVPIGGGDDSDEDNKYELDPADTRENPEQNLLRQEGESIAAGYVDNFLKNLNKSVRGKAKQYNRMVNVLWYCYLSSDSGTQLEVAAMLGVSDSLVSDYRRRIEMNLQQLSFAGVSEARQFEQALRQKVRYLITVEEKITV
jgi:DNA-directed RNA polymerase specialized sigma subunit